MNNIVEKLEDIRRYLDTDLHPVVSPDRWDVYASLCDMVDEIIALLKEQEPRVMTLEEVKLCWRNREIAFLVEYNDGGNMVWMLYYGYLSTLEEIVLIDEIAHLHNFGVDGYGIDWRCWTSRPDEKRRAETPWN